MKKFLLLFFMIFFFTACGNSTITCTRQDNNLTGTYTINFNSDTLENAIFTCTAPNETTANAIYNQAKENYSNVTISNSLITINLSAQEFFNENNLSPSSTRTDIVNKLNTDGYIFN